ncbi:hypothetical protein ACOMHN_028866 [Nucella lapillus]
MKKKVTVKMRSKQQQHTQCTATGKLPTCCMRLFIWTFLFHVQLTVVWICVASSLKRKRRLMELLVYSIATLTDRAV